MREKIEKKLGESEPLKVLTLNYLWAIIDPNRTIGADTWLTAQNVLFKMIDAAYQSGVADATDILQKSLWEIRSDQSNWTDIIQTASKETEEWKTELRNRALETPIELDKFHKIGYPEDIDELTDIDDI